MAQQFEEIPIFLTFDENFVIPGGVAIYSLLKHASTDYKYRIFIAGGRISQSGRKALAYAMKPFEDRASIEYLIVDGEINQVWETIAKTAHFTVEVAYKLFIANILRQYDKIIISDVDVVFCGDVSEAYKAFTAGEGNFFAGVRPIGKTHVFYDDAYTAAFSPSEIRAQKYGISGGFLIADLKSIRESNKEKDFIECFKRNAERLVQSEQDIINLSCYGSLEYLPLRFLVCAYVFDLFIEDLTDTVYSAEEISLAMEHPVQLHFPGKPKPWESRAVAKSGVWYAYLWEAGLAPRFYFASISSSIKNLIHDAFRKARRLGELIRKSPEPSSR